MPEERMGSYQPWLCVLAGRPGTGKTTLAKQLSRITGACYLRVDAVNAVPEARAGWHKTAKQCGARLILLETVLPDVHEHRRRVESRVADIPGHRTPTWDDIQVDGWVPWDEARDGFRYLVDTTDSEKALRSAQQALAAH